MSNSSGASSNDSDCTTVVRLCGSSTSPCGYCQGKRSALLGDERQDSSSKSYGILASSISASAYEALLYRGWRRSGQHLYKPDNWNSCCPALSIRLQADLFVPTKSQRRVLRNIERALQPTATKTRKRKHVLQVDSQLLQEFQSTTFQLLKSNILSEQHAASFLQEKMCRYKVSSSGKKQVVVACTVCAALAGRSEGILQRDGLCKSLAALLQDKLSLEVTAHESSGQVLVTLPSSALVETQQDDDMDMDSMDAIAKWWTKNSSDTTPLPLPPYELQVTTLDAHESALQPAVHKLYFLYQQEVHGDPNPLTTPADEEDWGVAPSAYVKRFKSMLQDEYNDNNAHMAAACSSFYRFLVESPLPTGEMSGTFHQHYRIQGRLIGVGVVDLLPNGVSSVYAFYDPTWDICALGKYMSLREIEYCVEHNFKYYYLGYYIESCPKMRYKANFMPSELLCPTHYKWVDAAKAQDLLLKDSPERHCCTLYKEKSSVKNSSEQLNSVMNEVQLDVGAGTPVTLEMLHPNGQEIVRPLMEEFVREVGPDVSRQCLVKLV